MYYTKRLLLLAICVISLGSASESQYLPYAIESLDEQEIIDRLIERNDNGFPKETAINAFQSNLVKSENINTPIDFQTKGHYSYSRKSAYY